MEINYHIEIKVSTPVQSTEGGAGEGGQWWV